MLSCKTNVKEAKLFVKSSCLLGEGILWDSRENCIFWVDVLKKQVHRMNLSDHKVEVYKFNQYVSKIMIAKGGGFILGMKGMLASWMGAVSEVKPIVLVEDSITMNRTNDGAIDPFGNIWIGTMSMDAKPNAGKLYCYKDGRLKVVLDQVSIPNGLVWTDNDQYVYFVDSYTKKIKRYQYINDRCELTNSKVIVEIPADLGLPDGMCLGPDGNLWVAHWGGYGVYCWDINTGKLLKKVSVDAPHITSCTFGGKAGNDLFITTARDGLSNAQLKLYPNSGSVFHYVY